MKKLYFLGTAGDVETLTRGRRTSGGFILDLDGDQFHVDPGPNSLSAAKSAGVNPRGTIAVVATNNSLLRSHDVDAVIAAMTLDGMDKHGVLLASKSVIEGLRDEPSRASPRYKACVEGLLPLSPQNKVGVNNTTLYPVKTHGRDPTGIGVRFETDQLLIAYTGDTGWYESIANDYADVDVLIVNCAHPSNVKEHGSLNVDEAEELIAAVKPHTAFLTGFSMKLLNADLRDVARQIQRRTKVAVTAVVDGDSFELDGRKKRLV